MQLYTCVTGSKGVKLVEQKVPATYVQLQDVISMISEERKLEGKDPVLHTEEYRYLYNKQNFIFVQEATKPNN